MGTFSSIAKFFQDGGFAMWVILVMLGASVAIWIERFYALQFKYSINAPSFWKMVSSKILAGQIQEAVQLCKTNEKAMLPRVLMAALQKAGRDEREIQDAVDEINLEIMPLIEKRTPYLGILANVATLTGLLGTIFGLISAFASLGSPGLSPSDKQLLLAGGISMAMNTTAFGLMTAIPTMIIHGLFLGKQGKIVGDIDIYSVKAINLLSSSQK